MFSVTLGKALILFLAGCGELNLPVPPQVTRVQPDPAVPGEEIVVSGSHFGSNRRGGLVSIDDVALGAGEISFWSDSSIRVPLPFDTIRGLRRLAVHRGVLKSAGLSFSVAEQPGLLDLVWQPKAPLPYALYNLGCAALDGKIYVVGGESDQVDADLLLVYDPSDDSWTAAPRLPTPRSEAAVVGLDGNLWVLGGYHGDGHSLSQYMDAIEVFSPAGALWTERPPLLSAKSAVAACTTESAIFLSGGFDGALLDQLEKVVPSEGRSIMGSPLSSPRRSGQVVHDGGSLYLIGGEQQTCKLTGTVARYDLAADRWTGDVATLPFPRSRFSIVQQSGVVYLLGGKTGCLSQTDSVVALRLDTFETRELTRLAEPRFGSCAVYVAGKIFLIGGARCSHGSCDAADLEVLSSVLEGTFVSVGQER